MVKLEYFQNVSDIKSDGRSRKKRETAHRIFMSAIDLMRIDGFDAVSVEQICARAEIARATFFQHFPSKAALLGVFSDIVHHRLEEELSAQVFEPEEELRLIANHMQGLIDELGPVAPDMLSAYVAEPGSRFRIDEPGTGVAHLVVGVVKKGQVGGVFTTDQTPENVAITIVASWVAVSQRRVAFPELGQETSLHKILDLVLNGLKATT